MFRRSVDLVTAFCLFNAFVLGVFEEPVCSKFHFEEKVLEKLIKMEVRVDSELKRLAEADNVLREKLASQTTKTNALAEAYNDLKEKLASQKSLTDALVETDNELKYKLASQTEALQAELADLQMNVSKGFQSPETPSILKNSDPVFFVVHGPSEWLGSSNPIVYKTVVANHGGGYDTGTGKFTAPSGGVFIFSAQICAGNRARYQILVNNSPYSSSYEYSTTSGVCSSVSTTALLAKGDQIWVKILNNGVKLWNMYNSDPLWNMFTGTLVNSISP